MEKAELGLKKALWTLGHDACRTSENASAKGDSRDCPCLQDVVDGQLTVQGFQLKARATENMQATGRFWHPMF